jgi:hypothetical protein
MSKIIHLEELALARRVVRDYPAAIQKLDNCINILYADKEYIDIATSINQLRESKYMMELTLDVYKEYLEEMKNEAK